MWNINFAQFDFTIFYSGCHEFRCRVPLYMVFTLPLSQPPITRISVDDKTATVVMDRGAGRSLMWIQELVEGEYV